MAEAVRVRQMMPPGHVRTPAYLRGKIGMIERSLGRFPNPEVLAYHQPAEQRDLYRVRFRMGDIWGDDCPHPEDTLDAEIYAHWLEKVEPTDAS